MICWDEDLPENVAQAYAIWDSVAKGNVSETARLLGARRPTIQEWSQRYRWKERQAEQRQEDRDRTIANAWATLAAEVDASVDVVLKARSAVYGPDGKPKPGDPTPTALKAAVQHLGILGVSVQRTVSVDVTHSAPSAVTHAELQALIDAGDTDTLLALAMGRTPPALQATAAAAEPEHGTLEGDFALVSGANGQGELGREP
jgi:hypothetical protein